MNYDQIIRELEKIGITPIISRHGGSKGFDISFNRKNSRIEGSVTFSYRGGYTGGYDFHSNIYEEVDGNKFINKMNPNNQTEFFKIIKELKTTNISLDLIRNRKMISETEKKIEKLTEQFRETDYRLNERKSWLGYLKGEITRKEQSKINRENRIRIYGE